MADARTNAGKLGSRRPQALNSRGTSLLIAVLCAVLAGVLIYLFVHHYNKSSNAAPAEVTVYKAKTTIPSGTPAAVAVQNGMLQAVQIPATQAQVGAISDPSEISGQVVSQEIERTQQITTSDFTHESVTIASYLSGNERAIAFPLDPSHGLTAYIAQGDTVDIMGQSGGDTEVLAQDVTVLANASGDVVLRVTDKQALALASDSGVSTMWLTLRPVTGAKESVKVGSTEKS